MEPILTVVGVSHQTGAVSVREALAPRTEEAGRLNQSIRAAAGLADAVVLSTCSRFEVYATVDEEGAARLTRYFSRRASGPLDKAVYVRRGPEAVTHLLRVSAGLNSWVIGETEVLGQVKSAYQTACQEKTAARPLHLAFQKALFVGKKVRSETAIVGGIASIGGAAAILARRIFSRIEERRILVFGAGAMAASTVRHLKSKGIAELWVANRSPERAATLAEELGGKAMGLEEGLARLSEADVAVFSTGAPSYLLDAAGARELSRRRAGKPIFVIDLGLPRNVDPDAAKQDGMYIYDMDDLRKLVEDSLRRRESDMAAAESIVASESADCWARIAAPAPESAAADRSIFPSQCPLRAKLPMLQTT